MPLRTIRVRTGGVSPLGREARTRAQSALAIVPRQAITDAGVMAFGLQRFDLSTITKRLELPEISTDPAKPLTLITKFCGTGNKAWENATFVRSAAIAAATTKAKADGTDVVAVEQMPRERDREMNPIFASTAIVAWENVLDDGAAVACTPENVERFLDELLDKCRDVWLRVVGFAVERSNFPRTLPVDTVDLGKG